MRHTTLTVILLLALLAGMLSCRREPPLHLHYDQPIDIDLPVVHLDIDVLWEYEIGYDWKAEWTYGWDEYDQQIFGNIGYSEPREFQIRRYFQNENPYAPHRAPDEFYIDTTYFRAHYKFGYYDLLVWNHIRTPDGVQSLIFDEQTTYDSVMVFTNMGTHAAINRSSSRFPRAFHQPEELFAAYATRQHVSTNPEDYDYFDPVTNTYHMHMHMTLEPVTYIYLTQVRLHNNRGRIDNVGGESRICGMARGACLNSGKANSDGISVYYYSRLKHNCRMENSPEMVDIIGGRCLTFGIPNQNSTRVTRAEDVNAQYRHYMDVNVVFNNGMDSTLVFDVTDQVRSRYRGGVITVDLDLDTVPMPYRKGGSAFDAVVKEFEEETHEFEM